MTASLPDDTDPQDIVSILIQIYRIQRGRVLRDDQPRATQAKAGEAKMLRARVVQVDAWRQLAGALAQGAAVITGNRRHYERVPGIVVEDWIRA